MFEKREKNVGEIEKRLMMMQVIRTPKTPPFFSPLARLILGQNPHLSIRSEIDRELCLCARLEEALQI